MSRGLTRDSEGQEQRASTAEQVLSNAGAGHSSLSRAGCPHAHKYSRCRQDWLGFDGGFARELLQGSLSFSVCVKHFPESKFCYRKTIYQMPPSADTLGRSCQLALTASSRQYDRYVANNQSILLFRPLSISLALCELIR